jgi:broad specificity phosphatase PhoE
MKLYFCRHGQTTGDVEDRYGGDYDDHLTNLGLKCSCELAEKLTSKGVEVIFSSPLIRAKETAKCLQEKLCVPIIEIPELKERNWYGILTGMTKAEALEKYPDQVELLKDFRLTLKDGEAYDDMCKRIIVGLNKIVNSNYKTVVVVIHGGVFKNMFREVFKGKEIKKIEDCGFAEVDWDGKNFNLIQLVGIEVAS